jgi:diguanylate cyclase (GGDEF)-like protein
MTPEPLPSDPLRIACWPPLEPAAVAALAGRDLTVEPAGDLAALRARLASEPGPDLAIVPMAEFPSLVEAGLADRLPVLVVGDEEPAPQTLAQTLKAGAQDVLLPADLAAAHLGLRLRAAWLRHRLAREARTAYATDLATGLPHQQQLLEHMSHLLALREREPAPMAVLVLRVEGLGTTEAWLGPEAASALRRKLAVRLRSGLRASDVVASIGHDSFAVLLAWIDAAADVDGVADKLVRSVQRPFSLSGQPVALAVSVGKRRYPDDGKDAATLLQSAIAEAAGQPGLGRAGFANHLERGSGPAANDE